MSLTMIVASLLTFSLWILREAATGIPVLNYHQINDEDINALTVPTAEFAREYAETEFEKYRVIQDRLFSSDFDKLTGGQLPELPFDEE